jgi:hypothetical protein
MIEKNPYKPGDTVLLLVDIKDSYGEIKHSNGDILEVKYISTDGKGVIFNSELGVNFSRVKLIKNKTIFCQHTADTIKNNLNNIINKESSGLIKEVYDKFILNMLSQAIELSK